MKSWTDLEQQIGAVTGEPFRIERRASASGIVLEHVELRARTRACDAALGERLAALHRHTSAHYGWHRDNTIGTTAQSNAQYSDWCAFWRERRLDFQLRLAR